MTTKYLLLNPLTTKTLNMPLERIIEVAINGGMTVEHAINTRGETCIYITSTSLDDLASFCDKNELDGPCLEYIATYNMKITLE